jgi:hypothetical protein
MIPSPLPQKMAPWRSLLHKSQPMDSTFQAVCCRPGTNFVLLAGSSRLPLHSPAPIISMAFGLQCGLWVIWVAQAMAQALTAWFVSAGSIESIQLFSHFPMYSGRIPMMLVTLARHQIKLSMACRKLRPWAVTRGILVDCRIFRDNVCPDAHVPANPTLGLCTLMELMLVVLHRKSMYSKLRYACVNPIEHIPSDSPVPKITAAGGSVSQSAQWAVCTCYPLALT